MDAEQAGADTVSLPEPEVATASELSQEPTAAADTAVPSTTNETTNAVASTAPDVTDAAPIVAAEAAAVATEAGAVAPSDASPATESAAPPAGIVEESAPSQDVEALPTVGQENENGDQLKDQLEQVTEQMKADAAETTAVTIADDTQQEFTTEVSERQLQSPLPESTDPATGDEGFHFMNTDPGVDPEQEVILTSAAVLSRSGSTEELGGLDVDALRIGVETPTLDTDAAIDQKEEQQQQQQPEQVQVVIAPAEPDIEIDRERVKAEIKAALEERDSMRGAHTSLQSRLVDYFRKKKSDEINVDDRERTQIDQETRYTNALANWQRLEQEFSVKRDENQVLVRQLYAQMEEKRADAAQKDAEARKFRRQTCLAASHGKTGKPILASTLEQVEQTATRKNAEVSAVLLENIKLVNRLRRSENLLRQKEELADGLSLIDFEQLKIENQTFTDKIEERNEDVNKLKKKITTIVQMLTHLKEKMAFTQADNVQLREELSQLDGDVSALRDSLPTLKVERDKLRKHNITLQHQNGLRGNKMLLRDYETKVDLAKALQTRVDALRASYNKLASECNSAKKKLQKSNAASFLSGSGPVSRDAPHFNATSLSSGGI